MVLFPISHDQSDEPNDEHQTCSRKDDVIADGREIAALTWEEVAGVPKEVVERVLRYRYEVLLT